MFDGYSEARKFDELINRLLEENPINTDNVPQWSLFARILLANGNALCGMCQSHYQERIKIRNGKDK